jgi:hypothetical protein
MMKRLQLLLTLTLFLGVGTAFGQVTFNGNENGGFGEPIGGSNMSWADDGTTITVTFTKGVGDFNDYLVIYIDNGTSTGRTSIGPDVNDRNDGGRSAISYIEATNNKTLTFPSDFEATHAIAINTAFGGLWEIPSSGSVGNNGLPFVSAVGNPNAVDDASFTFSFNYSDLGISDSQAQIKFVATYLNPYGGGDSRGYVSNEGYGSGFPGTNVAQEDLTLTGFESYYRFQLTTQEGFRLLSSPVEASYSNLLAPIWTQGATTGADTDSGDPNVFTYNTSTDSWDGLTDLSGNITAGTGFLVNVFADDDYDGSDDSWPKTLSVTGTENSIDASPTLNSSADGFTLVGNPFASTIDFDDVSTTDLTDVIYIWDANDETGDGGKNNETVSGSWKTYTKGGGGDVADGLVKPFQGFFVENANPATAPDITFGAASKSTGGTFYGKTTDENRSIVRLELGNSTLKNSMWLSFSEEGSVDARVMGDALELEPLSDDYAQLATKKAGTLFDIAHLPVMASEYTVPLSIEATKPGSYTLNATKLELPDNMTLLFHDYELGVEKVITEDFSYQIDVAAAKSASAPVMDRIQRGEFTLQATTSSATERYGISVKPNETTSNESTIAIPKDVKLAQNYPNPFNPSTTISFTLPEAMNVTVTVFDVLGREVSTLAANKAFSAGTTNLTWDASGLNSGMYIYRLQANGVTMTRTMTLIK